MFRWILIKETAPDVTFAFSENTSPMGENTENLRFYLAELENLWPWRRWLCDRDGARRASLFAVSHERADICSAEGGAKVENRFWNSLVLNLMWFPLSSPRLPWRTPRSWKGYCVPDEEGLITEELYYIIGKGLCWGSSQLGTWLIVSSSFNTDKPEESEEEGEKEKKRFRVMHMEEGAKATVSHSACIRLLLSHSGLCPAFSLKPSEIAARWTAPCTS